MDNVEKPLTKITQILLQPEDQYNELTEAIDDLYRLFVSVSEIDLDTQENRNDIFVSNGKAIGATWAAICVKEILRTKRFIRGVYEGIKTALERFDIRPLHIVYAGTGPFAALAIPLTSVFSSEEISFTLLEINPTSIKALKKVIKAFQVEDYIIKIVECDAAKYQLDKSRSVHMIITETMQNALQKEPQVAITMNLVPQMEQRGILIPQNITIDAVLMSPEKNKDRMIGLTRTGEDYYRFLGRVFELDKETAFKYSAMNWKKDESLCFPRVSIEIPQDIMQEYWQLCLFTEINVFEDVRLTNWQCSLNLPKKIMDMRQSTAEKISFYYAMNDNPGLVYKMF
ncbi:hypothetical protein CACET_c25910 [Clostridium aceticum]|uniref:Uncharacterized protein n=1 Tax=Clostridium aceticum TaxID=84022 RepID=A0A0D8ICW3_9CLOT|nr:phytanoyl-CoA dioxygenase [Clostridium aceticum]AKL96036.1 hypothetical protein CACET_c25910 [Clostridium aceticum]KJF27031.1 phytanoyl-CoA dioxygenase [Clostridium aceticum]